MTVLTVGQIVEVRVERLAFGGSAIAHHDGNYTIDNEGLRALEGEDRVAFRYVENANGSVADIAGVLSANRRVLGMMPHPERAVEAAQGGTDGSALFRALSALA